MNLNTTSIPPCQFHCLWCTRGWPVMRERQPITGKIITNPDGSPKSIPGSLKAVRPLAGTLKSTASRKTSMNLTNIIVNWFTLRLTRFVKKQMNAGIRVTGSELVPLCHWKPWCRKNIFKQTTTFGWEVAKVNSLRLPLNQWALDELAPFKTGRAHYWIPVAAGRWFKAGVSMNCVLFADETASKARAGGVYFGVCRKSWYFARNDGGQPEPRTKRLGWALGRI